MIEPLRPRLRALRRRVRDDSGAVLIFALLLITTISLVAAAVLIRGDGALRVGVALRGVAASTYQADAAGNIVVNDLRTGFQDPTSGVTVGGNNPADPSDPTWVFNNAASDGCFGQKLINPGATIVKDGDVTLSNPASNWRAYVVCKGELGTGNQGSHTVVTTENRPQYAIETLLPQSVGGKALMDKASGTPAGSLDLRSKYGSQSWCAPVGAPTTAKLASGFTLGQKLTTISLSNSFGLKLFPGTQIAVSYKSSDGVVHTQTFTTSVLAQATDTALTVKQQAANYAYPKTSTTVQYVPVPIYLQGDLGAAGNLCNEGPVTLAGGSVYASQCFNDAGNPITLDSGPLGKDSCGHDSSSVTDPGYASLLQVNDDGSTIATPKLPPIQTIPPATDTVDVNAGGFLRKGVTSNPLTSTDCRLQSTTTKQVFTLQPGSYESVAGLNSLTSNNDCVVWFKPGVYYFDFRDANTTDDPEYMGAGGAVGWRITAGTVIGGNTASATGAPDPATLNLPAVGGCIGPQDAQINPPHQDADAAAAAQNGVQFIFGGESQMELSTVNGSSAGSGPIVDLCGRYSLHHPPIVLYGLKSDPKLPGDSTGGSTATSLNVTTVNAPGGAACASASAGSFTGSGTTCSGTGTRTCSTQCTWALPSSGSGTKTETINVGGFAPTSTVAAGSQLIGATLYATYCYKSGGSFAAPTINLTPTGGTALGALTLPTNATNCGTPSEQNVVLGPSSNAAAFNALKASVAARGFAGAASVFTQTATGTGSSNTATFGGARIVLTLAQDTGSSATTAVSGTSGTWAVGSGAAASWSYPTGSSKQATLKLSGFSPSLPSGAIVTGVRVSILHRESNNGNASAPTVGVSVGTTPIATGQQLTPSTNTAATAAVGSYLLSSSQAAALADAVAAAGGTFSGLTVSYAQTLSGGTGVSADVLGASISLSYAMPGLRPLMLSDNAVFWHDTVNDPCEPGCGDNPTDSSLVLIDQRASGSTGAYVVDHNFEGEAYFEGMIYSPTADARIGLPNANNASGTLGVADAQSFAGWGMVFRSAFIERAYSVPNQANGTPYLGTPWVGTGAGQDSATVQFQVYLCNDMTSPCNATQGSRLALNARVQLLDNDRDTTQRSVNILSWSHQR